MENIIIKLLNNGGKKWCRFDESYIKGFAFIENRLLNEEEIFHNLLMSIKNNTLNEKLLELNGNYSAIITHNKKTFLFADKLKTHPLLYTKLDGKYYITDQASVILENSTDYKLDDISIASYLATGYLYSNKTFLKDCFIVSAGTYVVIDQYQANSYVYHTHIYDKKDLSDEEIMEGCVQSMENAIKRMVESVGERPIWIPLSGGYDSRLIACVLKKMNISNVKCFTYGISGSNEIRISKQVANELGFPWYCVDYTSEKILSAANSPIDDKYILWGMNLNTTSHFQDLVAIKELRENGIIEDNAVIVPGHSGEILGRDQVPYNLLDSNKSIAELIFYKYFQWNIIKKKYRKIILQELGEELNKTIANNNKNIAVDLFTNWNIQNRQANFIVNSVRVYEFFNLDWRVPLWDDELSYFWYSLDYIKNSNVLLYNKFLFEKYFIPMNVAIYKNTSTAQKIVAKIRIPFGIKDIIKTRLSKLVYFKTRYDENDLNSKTKFYLNKLSSTPNDAIQLKKTNSNAVLAAYQIDLISKYSNL